MNIDNLAGEWKNSKFKTAGIERFYFRISGDELFIEPFGASDSINAASWGSHKVSVFSTRNKKDDFSAFMTSIEISDQTATLCGNINKGLIIIAMYIKSNSKNGTGNYFIREFFFK